MNHLSFFRHQIAEIDHFSGSRLELLDPCNPTPAKFLLNATCSLINSYEGAHI